MKKVILIEDEVFISDLYKRMLEKAGFTVVVSFDGEEGLNSIRKNEDADLVLLDVMLPKKHGIDVLKEIKKDDSVKNIKVILLSNLGDEGVIREAFKDGIYDYIKKISVSPQQLVEYVGKYGSDPEFKLNHHMQ